MTVKKQSKKFWAVVPAAGVGRRMQSSLPKQYLTIQERTILDITLHRLIACASLEKILVVVSPDDQYWQSLDISQHEKIETVFGGEERCHSVLNGLKTLALQADDNDWVLVHDAARPCLRLADLEKLIAELQEHPVGGILGMPVRDTMKRVEVNGAIIETVDRTALWHALTPQMFRIGLLRNAIDDAVNSGQVVTDEASAIEKKGLPLKMVEGHSDNIKVTQPADLALAGLYLDQQH